MPTIQIEGRDPIEVAEGTKLVLALEDHGVDVLHRCGGNARCTTCAVEIVSGEALMSETEAEARRNKGIDNDAVRLSCQVKVQNDLHVKLIKTASSTGLDPGPRPQD
ncbi:2Fe-2S iron-sulfur cluster-binding protein [Paenibacillus lemnae]|uniref:(2Fe-2S)-binding protein n=1 Tax=Paenibacillus lemnae TaxID=1330551 RepID=A0A848M9Y7_PAELE|nr:2Fe-2S iron-sulfur cluster-binding protein [Paenibacillus lemnae]NMO97069.1 (2Fe-2S)-binding protein [Paenibacillus lemnae]